MNTNKVRLDIVKHLRSRLNDIIPNTPVADLYADVIMKMSDKELAHWIEALENGIQDFPDTSKPVQVINIISPNLDEKNALSTERNLKLAKKMGHNFFERLWLTNPVTGQVTLTNRKYLVMDLPVRRQSQTISKKMSMPDGVSAVDERTDQVTGRSKGSSLSYPEIQMLSAQGLDKTIYELIKVRGGDLEAQRAMMHSIQENGSVSQTTLENLGTITKANIALDTLLNGMHIKSNLVEK